MSLINFLPTCVSLNNLTCINHIWFNQLMKIRVYTGIINVPIANHLPTFFLLPLISHSSGFLIKYFRAHNPTNMAKLKDPLITFRSHFGAILFCMSILSTNNFQPINIVHTVPAVRLDLKS